MIYSTVNIISTQNGVGLARDSKIIQDLLSSKGIDSTIHDFKDISTIGKAQLNIFCEIMDQRIFKLAKYNIHIPNPEWFASHWKNYLPYFDSIFCKTHDTFNIFSPLHYKCVYTSFTSVDRYNPSQYKIPALVHLPGKSETKNTEIIVDAFRNSPIGVSIYHNLDKYKNIKTIGSCTFYNNKAYLDDEQYRTIQNHYLFHLCPSSYEGFGHYINEAKSTAAFIITLNAAPMNELVNANFGIGVACHWYKIQHLATLKKADPKDIYEAAKMVLAAKKEDLELMGLKARQSYLDNDLFFKEQFINEIKKYVS